jgi:hypothetical protein
MPYIRRERKRDIRPSELAKLRRPTPTTPVVSEIEPRQDEPEPDVDNPLF